MLIDTVWWPGRRRSQHRTQRGVCHVTEDLSWPQCLCARVLHRSRATSSSKGEKASERPGPGLSRADDNGPVVMPRGVSEAGSGLARAQKGDLQLPASPWHRQQPTTRNSSLNWRARQVNGSFLPGWIVGLEANAGTDFGCMFLPQPWAVRPELTAPCVGLFGVVQRWQLVLDGRWRPQVMMFMTIFVTIMPQVRACPAQVGRVGGCGALCLCRVDAP